VKEDAKYVTRIPWMKRPRRAIHCEDHYGCVEKKGKPSGRRCERPSEINNSRARIDERIRRMVHGSAVRQYIRIDTDKRYEDSKYEGLNREDPGI